MAYVHPQIPPEADNSEVNEQNGGMGDTILNFFGRFRRSSPHTEQPTSVEISHQFEHQNMVPQNANENGLQAFKADDVFIRHCDLRKNGASMQSLSVVDSDVRSSPCSYYQFAKTLG